MAAPPKPWEMAGVSSRMATDTSGQVPNNNLIMGAPASQTAGIAPPAVPPRPYTRSGYGNTGYSPYGGGYNSCTYGGYGGYGGYGSGFGSGYGTGLGSYGSYGGLGNYGLGNYMGGFNRMGGMYGSDYESRFIQLAEENTRPTFQSIESIVGAVGSVAMMLENTFLAMTSSFRAILGVAENFGRLRSLFAQFWSAFAVFRGINWLVRKLMVMLGIRTEQEFKAWSEAAKQTRVELNGENGSAPKASSWPAILFLAVIGAVPYIVMKMLGSINSTIQGNASDPTMWQNPMQAIAQYDFQATSPQELSFKAHQIVTIAPQSLQGNLWNSGWLMASVDQKTTGVVPVNYFKIIKNGPETAVAPPTSVNSFDNAQLESAIANNESSSDAVQASE